MKPQPGQAPQGPGLPIHSKQKTSIIPALAFEREGMGWAEPVTPCYQKNGWLVDRVVDRGSRGTLCAECIPGRVWADPCR